MKYRVLAINPGSTSTKISVFDDDVSVFIETLRHKDSEIAKFEGIIEQFEFRKELVIRALAEHNIKLTSLEAVVGRGGLVKSLSSGTYKINDKMKNDLSNPKLWGRIHASNLGAFIADSISKEVNIPAYIVDPVTVDEFEEIARISGCPQIERKSLLHALNLRYCGYSIAEKMGKEFIKTNQIGVHLGGGISVAAIKQGKLVDVNNAVLGMGPFSPQRAGALPIGDLLGMAFSGKYSHQQMKKMFTKTGGLIAYLGTDNGGKIIKMIQAGDKKAKLVFDAMLYQISKEVGACATVLEGKVDAIFLTGGLVYNDYVIEHLKRRISFIADVHAIPGEKEMEALTQGVVRVLKGLERSKKYK